MPGPGASLRRVLEVLREPVFDGSLSGLLAEPFRSSQESLPDESVGSFFRRRISPSFVDNLASALLHGVYAGDIDRLSLKALFPKLHWLENTFGSVLRGALALTWKRKLCSAEFARPSDRTLKEELTHTSTNFEPEIAENIHGFQQSSVLTFKEGLEALPRRILQSLGSAPNVFLMTNKRVSHIGRFEEDARKAQCSKVRYMIS